MPRTDEAESRRYVFECAWHYSVGMTVDQISAATRRSRPTVYRALEQAREWRWLDDSPRLTMPPGPERTALEQHVADLTKANRVRDLFGRDARPAEVIVVPSPEPGAGEALAAEVCRVMRGSETYADLTSANSPEAARRLTDQLVAEAAAAPAVQQAGGDAEAVEAIVVAHRDRPYTAREVEASRRVGMAASERFRRALEEGRLRRVGVSWGYHVAAFVHRTLLDFPPYSQGRVDAQARLEHLRALQLFPLIGSLVLDPILDAYEPGTSCGAYANCVRLAAQIGAPPPIAISQPAAVPEAFHRPEALRGVWEYVQEDPSIQKVFGARYADRRVTESGEPVPDPAELLLEGQEIPKPDTGYISEADALFTGLGTCTPDSRAPRLGLLSAKERAALSAAGAVGDVSGHFFWDPTAPPGERQKALIRRSNSRVIGPRLYDFVCATQRAKDRGTLGTLVLARGAAKARVVRALCLWRATNILAIDSDLAEALIGES